jgi:hypothetical protein
VRFVVIIELMSNGCLTLGSFEVGCYQARLDDVRYCQIIFYNGSHYANDAIALNGIPTKQGEF